MKMKKTLIGIFALALTASLLSACAGQPPVEVSSAAVSDTSSTATAETSAAATAPATESEAPVSLAESECKAETIEVSAEDDPAEETAATDEEASAQTHTPYTSDIESAQPEADEAQPAITTAATTVKVEESPKPAADDNSEPQTDAAPVQDYSNIKWGDPIPDNITRPSGKKAKVVEWEETKQGKFVRINGGYYYSIQDWVDGKESLSAAVYLDGTTIEEDIESGRSPDHINWN